jgi:hypothetical protein
MIRVKRQATGSYTFTENAVDDDGNLATVAGPFTATVYDGAGVQIATPTATCASSVFSATVPVATLTKLDQYSIVWQGNVSGVATQWTTTVDLVGGYLFEIADLRAFDRAFSDAVKYPTAQLRKIRTWVEDVIEGPRAARVAFVPRGRRLLIDGNSPDLTRGYNPLMYGAEYRGLVVPNFELRTVNSVTVNGIDVASDQLANITVDDNIIWRSAGVQWPAWPFGKNNIKLHYEHGYDRAPGAITRAALLLAREYLVKSDLPGRATATSIGDQMFRLTIAGRDGVTGIPDVDAAIDQFGRKGVGIG